MKKLFMLLALVVMVSAFPVAVYADNHHGHDRDWKQHHDRQWRDHERDWKDHDREWKAYRYDRRWREEHAREWHDWYQWHKDNDSGFHLRIAGDEFELEIDR